MALMSNNVTFSPAFKGCGKPCRDLAHCQSVDRAIWKCAQAALARILRLLVGALNRYLCSHRICPFVSSAVLAGMRRIIYVR